MYCEITGARALGSDAPRELLTQSHLRVAPAPATVHMRTQKSMEAPSGLVHIPAVFASESDVLIKPHRSSKEAEAAVIAENAEQEALAPSP